MFYSLGCKQSYIPPAWNRLLEKARTIEPIKVASVVSYIAHDMLDSAIGEFDIQPVSVILQTVGQLHEICVDGFSRYINNNGRVRG